MSSKSKGKEMILTRKTPNRLSQLTGDTHPGAAGLYCAGEGQPHLSLPAPKHDLENSTITFNEYCRPRNFRHTPGEESESGFA